MKERFRYTLSTLHKASTVVVSSPILLFNQVHELEDILKPLRTPAKNYIYSSRFIGIIDEL